MVEIEDLFQKLSVEIIDEVQLPIPDIVILICKQKAVIFHLFFSLLGRLRVSFLKVLNKLIVVLV